MATCSLPPSFSLGKTRFSYFACALIALSCRARNCSVCKCRVTADQKMNEDVVQAQAAKKGGNSCRRSRRQGDDQIKNKNVRGRRSIGRWHKPKYGGKEPQGQLKKPSMLERLGRHKNLCEELKPLAKQRKRRNGWRRNREAEAASTKNRSKQATASSCNDRASASHHRAHASTSLSDQSYRIVIFAASATPPEDSSRSSVWVAA